MMDWNHINQQVRHFNRHTDPEEKDAALLEVAKEANLLDEQDQAFLQNIHYRQLNPQLRCKVLTWLIQHLPDKIEGHLTLYIFGIQQLRQWRDEGKQRYPDFELVLCIRNGREYLELSCYFRPLPSAPQVDTQCDFPWKRFWDGAEMFWLEFKDQEVICHNTLELTFYCYPDQNSFAVPGQMSDWQLQLSDDETHMSTVVELLT